MPTAGYSGTALIKKLGVKAGQRMIVLNQPPSYKENLGSLPADVFLFKALEENMDFIHFFTMQRAQLEDQGPAPKESLAWNGMLWISWPKKSSKVESDLDGNVVRQIGLVNGLMDVKVAAIDEVWSGLNFVYRLEDRPAS